ncbi:MAG: hypothetical protein KC547_16280, partial [Anaerolineae bacterium]|nr:hypothetical protein [Anaerolineae bacterium]
MQIKAKHDHIVLLAKVALIVSKLKLSDEELQWCFKRGPHFGMLDLNKLLLVKTYASKRRFDEWLVMVRFFQWRDNLPIKDPVRRMTPDMLRELLHPSAATKVDFEQCIQSSTTWRSSDVVFLLGPGGLDLSSPWYFVGRWFVTVLEHLTDCLKLLDRLGVTAQTAWNWVMRENNTTAHDASRTLQYYQRTSRQIRQAAKAKYDFNTWMETGARIRDNLRDRQIQALVAYLTQDMVDEGVTDKLDLYRRFLIDVEMGSCRTISRIVLAHSTVQLFVQRSIMDLEDQVKIEPVFSRQWKWMWEYRVWEANLKTFLYPENWIYPELRDDKSPFFIELESELLQDDITEQTAEIAYMNYLNKLSDVSRLEIAGLTHDDDSNVTHVIGRTRGQPHKYYYRRRVDNAYWMPWEEIDLDIESDHVVPVVYDRRLYLFWLIIKPGSGEKEISVAKPLEVWPAHQKYWQVSMAWSEYRLDRWSRKRLSDDSIDVWHKFHNEMRIDAGPSWGDFEVIGDPLIISEPNEDIDWYEVVPIPREHILVTPQLSEDRLTIMVGYAWLGDPSKARNLGSFVLLDNGNLDERVVSVTQEGMAVDFVQDTKIAFEGYISESSKALPGVLAISSTVETNSIVVGEDVVQEPVPTGPVVVETTSLLLKRTVMPYKVLLPELPYDKKYLSQAPFFFDDERHTFFVVPESELKGELTFGRPVDPPEVYPEDPRVPEVQPEVPCIIVGDYDPPPYYLWQGGEYYGGVALARHTTGANFTPIVSTPYVATAARPTSSTNTGLATRGWRTRDIFSSTETKRYRFWTFHHPYVGLFLRQLNRYGIEGLLTPQPDLETNSDYHNEVASLRRQQNSALVFTSGSYDPNRDTVKTPYPIDDIDFSFCGAYSLYNW